MTKTSKRLISVLICLTLVLAMLPMAVFAADTTTIYLNTGGSGMWDQADAWFCAWVWGGTAEGQWATGADADDDGVYEFTVPADATSIKFLRMDPSVTEPNWDNGIWNQTDDLTISNNCYTITGWGGTDGNWSEYGAPVVTYDYYVAGDSALCGSNWNASDTNNGMTLVNGVYSITYTNVAANTYNFKITDGTWTNAWGANGNVAGGPNYTFTVSSACDVTITFNAETEEIAVSGTGVGEYKFDVDSITVVGDGHNGFLNDSVWGVADASNHMTEIEEGVWSISYEVDAGSYSFKFAANDSWTENWGMSGTIAHNTETALEYNSSSNIGLELTYDLSKVTLILDLTNYDDSTKTGATCTVKVEEVIVDTPTADIKWQMTTGTTAESESTNVRFVTYVDSLDYQNVTFTIAIGDETPYTKDCTAVYEKLNADGAVIESASTIFGEGAAYFVAFTMENMPAQYFGEEITVTVNWYDLDGEVVKTAERTIVVSNALA